MDWYYMFSGFIAIIGFLSVVYIFIEDFLKKKRRGVK